MKSHSTPAFRFLGVLIGTFCAVLGCGAAEDKGEAIDFERARAIRHKVEAGQTPTAEERAYVQRAMQEMQKRKGKQTGASSGSVSDPRTGASLGGEGELANFEGVDGVKIAGYVRKPAGKGPFPLIIVLHGGAPTAKAMTAESETELAEKREREAVRAGNVLGRASHPPIPDFLAQGWAVYTIDYRPNPRYTLDSLEWDDTAIAIKRAREFAFVDQKRVAILGGSHGGHVTARMMARFKFAGAVVCAPAGMDLIELAKLAEQGTPIGANQRLVREMEQRSGRKMAEIEKDPAAFHYTSLFTEAASVQCPVLLISGRNDPNAPIAAMGVYEEKLRAAGKEIEVYHPDNGPHGFYVGLPKPIPETAESTRVTVGFLKKQFEAVR